MRLTRRASAVLFLYAAIWVNPASAAKPTVTLEIGTEQGYPITGAKDWYDLLTDLGVGGLQIRGATERDEPAIETVGRKEAPSYHVKGILKANNTLYVPGGKFALRDRGDIKKWLDNLGDQGSAGVTEKRGAFGLLDAQLLAVNADLKQPVKASTAGLTAQKILDDCGKKLKYSVTIDKGLERELEQAKIGEELQGLSTGTALALALRPAGLVISPQRPARGEIQYRIGKPETGHESWPVGWKPPGSPAKLLPSAYEMIDVEITDKPLPEVIAAIGEQLKVPMLLDQNAMALHGIDPSKVEVTLPAKKLSYSLILQKILFKAHLKPELRVDEAGKPFYWITSIKPS